MTAGHLPSDPFRHFIETIVAGNSAMALRLLETSPPLATERAARGATRQAARSDFFEPIMHYIYEGDTALHMAAAAYQKAIGEALIARGADVRARNRRGATPLHYAVDGGPGLPAWNPAAQAEMIMMLVRAGADPNAVDKNGVAPLHRAVRNRCAAAVRALIEAGADTRARNGNGSTLLLLATRATGRGGSGSIEAKVQQKEILQLLRKNGPST